MKSKIVLAFAGLLLMLTASFAPITQAPVPGSDLYVTMGGKMDGTLYMYVNNVAPNTRYGISLPMLAPFVTRDPYLSPMQLFEQISFAPPMDVNYDTVPDIIQIEKVLLTPIIHYAYVPFRGTFWQFIVLSPQAGGGLIFINPYMPGDVDCYTFNNDTGVYWTDPSQLAGTKAAESGGHYNGVTGDFVPSFASRFPAGGYDGVPGTRLWGDVGDGFGDGQPDPLGSSILMLPLIMMGNEWNGTHWDPKLAIPMPMVLTTGAAFDVVAQPESNVYGLSSTEVGMPWEFISLGASWDDPKAFAKVIYVCAWSNMLYTVNPDDDGDGVPDAEEGTGYYYTVDQFYEYAEKKVREDVVIADINCDQTVTISDIVIGALAFGAEDEGLGRDGLPGTADDKPAADPNFDARADLSGDGLITIVDLVRMAVDFGKTIGP